MFTVDITGLRKQIVSIPKVLIEPIQNALDEKSTRVDIEIKKEGAFIFLKVVDDNPEGFKDLSHAYTLFAESEKKNNPLQRGRFNMGEKFVVAVSTEATITTTTGQIQFLPKKNRMIRGRKKTEKGSIFEAKIKMSQADYDNTICLISSLIPPKGILTTLNGTPLSPRVPIKTFQSTLETIQGEYLTKTKRKCDIEIHYPLPGEEAQLYEMGIPVVEIDSPWHINVMQKVPLNRDRDNVTPAYKKALIVEVVNNTIELLRAEDANSVFVKPALSSRDTSKEALEAITNHLFDKGWVSHDMSDAEANSTAHSEGITVVRGSQLNKQEWANLRDKGLVTPAGKAFPTPKGYDQDSPHTEEIIPEKEWSEGMKFVAHLSKTLATNLLGVEIRVKMSFAGDVFRGCYGHREITFNVSVLGKEWFEQGLCEEVIELILHELAHEYESNHLSRNYTKAVCKLAARFYMWVEGAR